MQYPNKTYVGKYDRHVPVLGHLTKTVVIVARNEETAREHLIDKLGSAPEELIWLMDCQYKTIYDQTGNKIVLPQAKILYNA